MEGSQVVSHRRQEQLLPLHLSMKNFFYFALKTPFFFIFLKCMCGEETL